MHILLTGGCGYIGSVLTSKLLALEHRVTVFDIQWFGNYLQDHRHLTVVKGDIRDIETVPMDGIDTVIHLANIANDPCGDLDSKLAWEVNVLASKLLVEKAIANGVKHFIFASSGSVYGVKDEDQVTEDLSLVPISDYNKTKMISERVLLSYRDQIALHIIRPATVCGFSPRMRLDVSVNLLTAHAMTTGVIKVFGGDQVRPNIHIQDITDVFIHFMNLGNKHTGIYNAGFENISILDIAKMVAQHTGADIEVTASNDPRCYRLNADKLLATGFKPKFKVEHAINEVSQAFKEGRLENNVYWHNIETMKLLHQGQTACH